MTERLEKIRALIRDTKTALAQYEKSGEIVGDAAPRQSPAARKEPSATRSSAPGSPHAAKPAAPVAPMATPVASKAPVPGKAPAPPAPLATPPSPARPTAAISAPSAPREPSVGTRSSASNSPKLPRLETIATEVKSCVLCELSKTRTNTVFSRGNPEARVCFIGEAPGADEDETGFPFVGRAGQLLDKMIGAMGLNPETDVYVCNIIKCRPPENRKPTSDEMATCFPYLHRQMEIVRPEVIVAMGNTAVSALLETKIGITKLRGQWKLYKGTIPVMPTYHPSYLIRPSANQQTAKKEAWEDLQSVLKQLGLPVPKRT